MERFRSTNPSRAFGAMSALTAERSDSLSGGKRLRSDSRQEDLEFCPFARLAIETDPATQTIRDDVVDDMEAVASAALVSARREERIERLAPDIEAHATAIIGKENFKTRNDGKTSLTLKLGIAFGRSRSIQVPWQWGRTPLKATPIGRDMSRCSAYNL
jgi:hypothetical protein